jgi:hypothetical protein
MKPTTEPCPFCSPPDEDILLRNPQGYTRYDHYRLFQGRSMFKIRLPLYAPWLQFFAGLCAFSWQFHSIPPFANHLPQCGSLI